MDDHYNHNRYVSDFNNNQISMSTWHQGVELSISSGTIQKIYVDFTSSYTLLDLIVNVTMNNYSEEMEILLCLFDLYHWRNRENTGMFTRYGK